ncbi:unnamed protein product [Schistosoma margrebowiei]|uniref:Uncharacterized protein n=1 Tax=Schistosoma margrebowiei TaxID=48269 RepID=A0A183MR08_9TREM|nr:unnamed protein product [Schistosoma margrebowiei]
MMVKGRMWVVGGSQQETLDASFVLFGTRQQGIPVILREMVLPDGFHPVSPSITIRDVTTEQSEPPMVEPHQSTLTLNNKYQALQDLPKEEETTMVDNWKWIKEALTPTCQEVLGSEKHHHKEWISIKTLNKMKERKNKKTTIYNSRKGTEKVKA